MGVNTAPVAEVNFRKPSAWYEDTMTAWKRLNRKRQNLDAAYEKAQIRKTAKSARNDDMEDQHAMIEFFKTDLDTSEDYLQELTQTDRPRATLLRGRIKALKEMHELVIGPIRDRLNKYLIRRVADSCNYLGQPVVTLPPHTEQVHHITLSEQDREAYDLWEELHVDDSNFRSSASIFLIDPVFVFWGFFNPHTRPGPKVQKVIELIKPLIEHNKTVPAAKQKKFVLYTAYSKTLSALRARLAKEGIDTTEISGSTSAGDRYSRQRDFQSLEPHASLPLAVVNSDTEIETYPVKPCWGMVITSVGASGLNLHRAEMLIMLDPCWSVEQKRQIKGRLVRQGQTNVVQIHEIVAEDTVDTWKTDIAAIKGQAAGVLLDKGDQDPTVAISGTATQVGPSSGFPAQDQLEKAFKVMESSQAERRAKGLTVKTVEEKFKGAWKSEKRKDADRKGTQRDKKIRASRNKIGRGDDDTEMDDGAPSGSRQDEEMELEGE